MAPQGCRGNYCPNLYDYYMYIYIGMHACVHVCVCVFLITDFLITFTNILLILLTKEFLIISVKLNAKRK